MAGSVQVAEAAVLAACLEQMRHVRGQIDELHGYAERWVAGGDGFTGVLRPLVPLLAEVAEAAGDLARGFGNRYDVVIEELAAAVRDLVATDDEVAAAGDRLAVRVDEVAWSGPGP